MNDEPFAVELQSSYLVFAKKKCVQEICRSKCAVSSPRKGHRLLNNIHDSIKVIIEGPVLLLTEASPVHVFVGRVTKIHVFVAGVEHRSLCETL